MQNNLFLNHVLFSVACAVKKPSTYSDTEKGRDPSSINTSHHEQLFYI